MEEEINNSLTITDGVVVVEGEGFAIVTSKSPIEVAFHLLGFVSI
jgi:hypothetical protein